MISTYDIAWLAGFFEGEGSFGWSRQYNSWGNRKYPEISASTTDADVAEKVSRITGLGVFRYRPKHYKPHWKDIYKIHTHGRRAVEWMMTLYSLLGSRRQARIREILSEWKASENPIYKNKVAQGVPFVSKKRKR